ncbi:MAG TPA: hypothetical protein DD982_02035 [Thalassospira sp.]|nr:hypothetical protein [Thalassospira sp.]HBS21292.1 hypothetical protein [Thalassospira sp.]
MTAPRIEATKGCNSRIIDPVASSTRFSPTDTIPCPKTCTSIARPISASQPVICGGRTKLPLITIITPKAIMVVRVLQNMIDAAL